MEWQQKIIKRQTADYLYTDNSEELRKNPHAVNSCKGIFLVSAQKIYFGFFVFSNLCFLKAEVKWYTYF